MKRIVSLLKSRRVWGLAGTAVVLYFLVFVIFGKTDVSGIMPDTRQIARTIISVWPRMPFFVQRDTTENGQTEIRYTVPTKQLTPQDLAELGVTNAAHPVPPKK